MFSPFDFRLKRAFCKKDVQSYIFFRVWANVIYFKRLKSWNILVLMAVNEQNTRRLRRCVKICETIVKENFYRISALKCVNYCNEAGRILTYSTPVV